MFGEDVPASFYYAVARKKRLRLLSEERLSPREEKTYGDLRHFFGQKKMAEREGNSVIFIKTT